MNNTLCTLPWVHQFIKPSGDLGLCCNSQRIVGHSDTMVEDWNNEDMQDIRRKMLAGEKVTGCERCYQLEAKASISARQRSNETWSDHIDEWDIIVDQPPQYLDIRFGNLCNLQCMMCSPYNSSQIDKEYQKLKKNDPDAYQKYIEWDPDLNLKLDWYEKDSVWELIDTIIPNLKEIYITGGEPTLIPQNKILLKRCIDTGHAQNIRIRMTTNLTNIDDELLDLISQFRQSYILCSIDSYKSNLEYIRYPVSWDAVEANLIKILKFANAVDGAFVNINCVGQMINLLSLPGFVEHLYRLYKIHNPKKANGKFVLARLLGVRGLRIQDGTYTFAQNALREMTAWKFLHPEHEDFILGGWQEVDSIIDSLNEQVAGELPSRSIDDVTNYLDFRDSVRNRPWREYCPDVVRAL